jgi:hypothetical protein
MNAAKTSRGHVIPRRVEPKERLTSIACNPDEDDL